ncbi:MAG: NusG domain II-containing protein [Streptococcaceae bacterium]|nr:NusG domain II-containing protein [Streptococcaceae bacterium]
MMTILNKYLKFKPLDFIIIAVLLTLSFLPFFLFNAQQNAQNKVWAELRVDGKLIKSFDLTSDKAISYRYIEDDGDYNLIEVKDHRIRIKEANCPDQVCIRRGWIKKAGETIVCLPHKLVIEVKTTAKTNDGDVIY